MVCVYLFLYYKQITELLIIVLTFLEMLPEVPEADLIYYLIY